MTPDLHERAKHLVTASTVAPASSVRQPPLPGSVHTAPNDWELYVQGAIEGTTAALPATGPKTAAGLSRLKGDGAWASYDAPAEKHTADGK